MVAEIVIEMAELYGVVGLLVAIGFTVLKIAIGLTWGARLILFPSFILLWPIILVRRRAARSL
jgi:hypothetical protein